MKLKMMKSAVKMDFAADTLNDGFMNGILPDACGDGGKSAVSAHPDLNGETCSQFWECGKACNFSSECNNGEKALEEQKLQNSISNIGSGADQVSGAIGAPAGALKACQADPSKASKKAFEIAKAINNKANLLFSVSAVIAFILIIINTIHKTEAYYEA